MVLFLLILLSLICGIICLRELSDKNRMLQFPFLVAATVTMQILPQLYALYNFKQRFPEGALERCIIMVILSLIFTVAGYYIDNRKRQPGRIPRFNDRILLRGAAVLVLLSVYFTYKLQSLPEEMLNTMWTGLPVRYLFFVNAGTYGFTIALIVFTRTFRPASFLLMLPGIYSFLNTIIFIGRRTPAAIFAMTILCVVWFNRRRTLPRWVMLAGLTAFTVYIFSIGDYRHIMLNEKKGELKDLAGIDFVGNMRPDRMIKSGADEMKNALYMMECVESTGKFDFGANFYNQIILYFVPRQIVGKDFKRFLMLNPPDYAGDVKRHMNYTMPIGTCATGIAESFWSLWYFGVLFFALMGYVMRRLWDRAMTGDIVAQMGYAGIMAYAIGVYNGTVGNFIMPWIHMILFIGPVFMLAHVRRQDPASGGGNA